MYYKTYINEIQLINFKKHKNLHLKFSKDLILIIGKNAVGKTSILESIFFMSAMKSFLDIEDLDLVQFDKKFSKIVILENQKNLYELVISEKGKFIQKNQVEYKKLSDFINDLNVLSFSNQDENIVMGSPKNRRYFLDFEIARINKKYLDRLIKYKKTLKIRNLCLKENKVDTLYLDILTKEIIELNREIMEMRKNYLLELNGILKTENLFDDEIYELKYVPNINENMEQLFKNKLEFDLMTKTTNYGIHRDDFEVILNGKNAASFASYGQVRSILLNLKIGVLEIIKKYKNILPVLLLDDLFSGLDITRRERLMEKLCGMQIFITTNDLTKIHENLLKNADIIEL